MKAIDPHQLLTVIQTKELLRCSGSYVYKLAESGLLRSVSLPAFGEPGKRKKEIRRFRYDDIVELIENCTNQGGDAE